MVCHEVNIDLLVWADWPEGLDVTFGWIAL